jgi:hypothetical protein
MVNAYRRISLFNHAIEVPNVPLRVHVDVHMVPDDTKQLMHIRIWTKATMGGCTPKVVPVGPVFCVRLWPRQSHCLQEGTPTGIERRDEPEE